MTEPIDKSGPHSVASSVEALLASIESKTVSSTHKRLLKAARAAAPQQTMETELAKILEEQLHET